MTYAYTRNVSAVCSCLCARRVHRVSLSDLPPSLGSAYAVFVVSPPRDRVQLSVYFTKKLEWRYRKDVAYSIVHHKSGGSRYLVYDGSRFHTMIRSERDALFTTEGVVSYAREEKSRDMTASLACFYDASALAMSGSDVT